MSRGDLSLELSSSLSVTWSIPDYVQVAADSRHCLRSPDFTFADSRHSLRLFQDKYKGYDHIVIQLMNLRAADPVLLCEVHLKTRDGVTLWFRHEDYKNAFFYRDLLEEFRDMNVPDGTLTVICFVCRLTKPSGAGSPEPGVAKTHVIPKCGASIGELSFQSFPFLYVTWRIPGFLRLSRESSHILVSPEFPFSDRRYHLRLFPSEGDVDMELVELADTFPRRFVTCQLGFKSTTGEEIYKDSWDEFTRRQLHILRVEMVDKKSEYFPDGHLTAFCRVRSPEPDSAGNPESDGAESQVVPNWKDAPQPKSVAVHTSNEEEDREALPGGVEKVLSDYKRLLLKGAESDACLVVGGKEFQAHKCVLRARSPVFEAMFDHETAEKASGRVVIGDLKPDRFEDFMEYVYTGRVESFCDDNAFGLYAAAEKYDLPTLKSECVQYMRRGLSVDNFCDVLTLALRHHERDLLELAVEFFKKNVADIILTVKWQQFMSENSTIANELFMKLHVPGRELGDVLLP